MKLADYRKRAEDLRGLETHMLAEALGDQDSIFYLVAEYAHHGAQALTELADLLHAIAYARRRGDSNGEEDTRLEALPDEIAKMHEDFRYASRIARSLDGNR